MQIFSKDINAIIKKTTFGLSLLLSVMFLSCGLAAAQTTIFSYGGKLPASVTPANGTFEMEFRLFDAAVGGNQIGANCFTVKC